MMYFLTSNNADTSFVAGMWLYLLRRKAMKSLNFVFFSNSTSTAEILFQMRIEIIARVEDYF